ncbi:hypothetical protein [Deinococcus soli (ex Cha et al. 2016)]|uniref:Uncharacterized protein n=2 Tax=Deinococcus soli (ex Cha et al. 2016) TaxID=1309411 RepID=A0ACC6KKT5_9DEIO|nr:hypothetical protein [Deinococcus soli (ex Cha et al. 2016)]MDR6218615.1 hypothetical protein [Deinococcus soli (ex Cha et al. 2016)]MDR6328412.1 hypothetical protein [Deinococcus soli (ex Cha et al. 2016)]MDR6753023.1 hypothetical protein [Deinococcus soli (ex Cha et al. 2016)]
MTPEETVYWEGLAQAARATALDKLQASASNWVKVLAALLGVLALVGVTLSPTAWDDRQLLIGTWDATRAAPALLVLMFLGLLAATWFANAGAQSTARQMHYDAQGYRADYLAASEDALRNIRSFRRVLLLTALPFLLYGLIGLLSGPKDANLTLFQATTTEGMYCGTLTKDPSTGLLSLTIADNKVIPAPGTNLPVITALTPVKDCYSSPPAK